MKNRVGFITQKQHGNRDYIKEKCGKNYQIILINDLSTKTEKCHSQTPYLCPQHWRIPERRGNIENQDSTPLRSMCNLKS